MSVHLALVIAALAAGVLLPKAVGPLLAPAAGDQRGDGSWQRFLDLLPPVILGSLTAITATGSNPRHASPWTILAVIGVVVIATALMRRKRPKEDENR